MAKYLQSTSDLIEYTKRKLGAEQWTVEISTSQWDDIIEDSKDILYDYSDYGLIDEYIVVKPNGSNVIYMDERIRSITACYGGQSSIAMTGIAYDSSSYIYQLLMNGPGGSDSLSSYVIMRQYINTVRELLNEPIQYDFNSATGKLALMKSNYEFIAFRVKIEEPINELVNLKFFKMLVHEQALRQWANNLSLKYSTENSSIIGNGLSLNSTRMLEEADRIRQEFLDGIEGDEYGSLIGLRKLYN